MWPCISYIWMNYYSIKIKIYILVLFFTSKNIRKNNVREMATLSCKLNVTRGSSIQHSSLRKYA